MQRNSLFTTFALLISLRAVGGCQYVLVPAGAVANTATVKFVSGEVGVIDAETSRPVANAVVRAPNPYEYTFQKEAKGTTDSEGRVNIRVAPKRQTLHVEADGYLPRTLHLDEGDATRVTVSIYRGPPALAGLSIPVGFRGVLDVEEFPDSCKSVDSREPVSGQRTYYTAGNVGGVTCLKPAPMLSALHYSPMVRCARLDDGSALPFDNPREPIVVINPDASGRHYPHVPVPQRPDGLALFHLGARHVALTGPDAEQTRKQLRLPGMPTAYYQVYFVGTADGATSARKELVAGSSSFGTKKELWSGYVFRPAATR